MVRNKSLLQQSTTEPHSTSHKKAELEIRELKTHFQQIINVISAQRDFLTIEFDI